ncbi:MAG: hypothetical protein N4A68_11765 [Maledivibacter sp.]|nr:hypothetical protein [Maledivibacter sp.]
MLFDIVGYFVKIAFLGILIVIILQYTMMNIAVYKIVNKAEEEGRFTYSTYSKYMGYITFDTSDIKVDKINPRFGEYTDKLGSPLDLEVSKIFRVTVFDKEISFPITLKKSGINTGYYGRGY